MRLFDQVARGETTLDARDEQLRLAPIRKLAHTAVRMIADEAVAYVEMFDGSNVDWIANGSSGLWWDDGERNLQLGPTRPPFDTMWIEYTWDGGRWAFILEALTESTFLVSGIGPDLVCVNVGFLAWEPKDGGYLSHFNVDDNALDIEFAIRRHFLTVLIAFAWCHCRNIEIVDVSPTAKQSRKQGHKKGSSGLSYKRIRIVGSQMVKASPRHSGLQEVRWHQVRGHFVTYTEDKPMFGREGMAGTFWVPAHSRGDMSIGQINHEYQVDLSGRRAIQ